MSDFPQGARSEVAASTDESFPALLPPDGKSPEEIEKDCPAEIGREPIDLDKLQQFQAPDKGAFRFQLLDIFVVITALATGLGVGRIDVSGFISIFCGGLATLALVRSLASPENSRIGMLFTVAALSLYFGATIGTVALLWLTESAAPTS